MLTFILGYSRDISRFSNKAYNLLCQNQHKAVKINPNEHGCYKSISDAVKIEGNPHTITMYVNPKISSQMIDEIIKARPERVIFNPGTENKELEERLKKEGIAFIRDCTLVMLNFNSF